MGIKLRNKMRDGKGHLETYIAGLKSHDLDMIDTSLVEDVQFITPTKTLDKPAILEFLAALYRGFPDWNYSHDDPLQQGENFFAILWRQGGQHTGTLEFSGFDAVEATGKVVSIPPHFFFYRTTDKGLREIRPDPIPGGAPRGIFEQIGVELPPI